MADSKSKSATIIVNTRPKEWSKKKISYEETVSLAFDTSSDNENIIYTVDYLKGEKDNHEGSLTPGKSVPVKDGMIFNVTRTDKS